jgi:undecaprenyl-diphosphatase
MEFLYSVDTAVFRLINQTLSNPVGDVLWPLITDYIRLWPVRIVLLAVWVWMIWKGGRRGRTAAVLLIPILYFSDTVSSSLVKQWVARPRPCHQLDGAAVVQGIHMLVECGPGKSFPSSHAVNNFAVATLFSFFYRKWTWAFVSWASLVALSRPAVGVHYPSDILGGALIGIALSALVLRLWLLIQRRWLPGLGLNSPGGRVA